MKKKHTIIGIFVLLIALWAYHFIAAYQAENQLDQDIQKQAEKAGDAVSVQYSSIDVSPFSGDVDFRDVTVVRDSTIERSSSIHIDLHYLDFLSLYFGGIQYALKHLSEANVTLGKPSFVNRETLREIKADTLRLAYRGNAWDALRSALARVKPDQVHQLSLKGTGVRYREPNVALGAFQADSIQYNYHTKLSQATLYNGESTIDIQHIIWNPPAALQQKYAFIIRGFGYQPDSIPVAQAHFSIHTSQAPPGIFINDGDIKQELCTIHIRGSFTPGIPMGNSRIDSLKISLGNPSQKLQNVLANAEQMFNIRLPREEGILTLRLAGTLENPRIVTK